MFFYNIMASHKTNKRSYKKRTPKRKTQKGGDINMFGYTCKEDEKKADVVYDKAAEVDDEDVVKVADDEGEGADVVKVDVGEADDGEADEGEGANVVKGADEEGEGADVVKVDVGEADDGEADEGEGANVVKGADEEESDDEGQNAGGYISGKGKKGRKSRKSTKKGRKSHKKNRKTMKKKKKSAWTTFVVDLYNKNKVKTKGYMFKNALSDAAKIYKK